jgi:hypothetical protein
LAQGHPQNAIGEVALYRRVVGQPGGQH